MTWVIYTFCSGIDACYYKETYINYLSIYLYMLSKRFMYMVQCTHKLFFPSQITSSTSKEKETGKKYLLSDKMI